MLETKEFITMGNQSKQPSNDRITLILLSSRLSIFSFIFTTQYLRVVRILINQLKSTKLIESSSFLYTITNNSYNSNIIIAHNMYWTIAIVVVVLIVVAIIIIIYNDNTHLHLFKSVYLLLLVLLLSHFL